MKRSLLTLFIISLLACCITAHAQYAWRLLLPRISYTVQINPLDPNKLYVGNTYDQIWRSNDGGTQWERIIIDEIQSDQYMTSIVVSSVDTNIVLFGGHTSSGIKRSVEGGRNATKVLVPPTGLMFFISEAIVEDPSNPRTLYAARGWPAKSNQIYRSTDVGETWDSIAVIDPTLTMRLCTIAIRPDSTNILFVGAKNGMIFKSSDYGHTFKQVPVLGDKLMIFDDSEIPKIVFSQVDPMVGYAVVAFGNSEQISGNGGLLKTTNGGESWNRVAFADTSLWAVEVRRSSVGTDDVFIGGFRFNHINTLVEGDSLVSRSLDGGSTWSRFANITWQPNEEGDSDANVWVLRYNKAGNKLYMATQLGLYVFDEPVDVKSDVIAHPSLHASLDGDVLRVTDVEPGTIANTWTLYNMQGAALATGLVGAENELSLNVARYASGPYVVTWGTEAKFRTVSFSLIR